MQRVQRSKRPRALQACEVCRTRKNRCNEEQPCTYCVEHDLECVYSRPHRIKRRHLSRASPVVVGNLAEAPPGGAANLESAADSYQSDSDARFMPVGDVAQISSSFEPFPVGRVRNQLRNMTPISLPSGRPGPSATARSESTTQQSATYRESAADVMDTNTHTSNLEFYGAASSVAFLRHVENISGGHSHTSEHMAAQSEQSLASLLHNTDFLPHSTPSTTAGSSDGSNTRFYFRVARKFIDAYFSSIHYIQPIFDEEEFLTRCEDLWFGKPEKQSLSFRALYHATLSLGSIIMVWDEGEIYGADRFSWSRRFFNEAVSIVTQLGSGTDIEMVQCYYMMGKVCQHELNPHVAYLYSGQATRTALAIGLNRLAPGSAADPRSSMTAANTWWAVYCLDIQTSFALGRPDSLGPDEFHTQEIPGMARPSDKGDSTSPQLLQIVPCMVELSRIMRRVNLRLYTLPCTVGEMASRARKLDTELATWLLSLPPHLQPRSTQTQTPSLKPRWLASHTHKQFVVLMIRYYNLRMIIYGKFLTNFQVIDAEIASVVNDFQQNCINSAGQAIDLIYDTFLNENFFQTWWYNSTYALFAVSVLLTAVFHRFVESSNALDGLFRQINRAIAVLEAMDECIVTRNATLIVKRTLARAQKASQNAPAERASIAVEDTQTSEERPTVMDSTQVNGMGPSAEGATTDVDFDWINTLCPVDNSQQQALFWVEWASHLEDLGA